MLNPFQNECLEAIMNSDSVTALALVDGWAGEYGYQNVISGVLDPILEELGDRWTRQKDVSFAQVYVSASIAEEIILKVLAQDPLSGDRAHKGTIVLGNIEDDFHTLGRRLVAIFLKSAGWDVLDLGNDVMAETFVDKAVEVDAKIIAVSAMMYTTAKNIGKVRAEIDARGYHGRIQLAVGGAVFNLRHELWLEVGADGSSRNAIDADSLMMKLQEKAMQAGGAI